MKDKITYRSENEAAEITKCVWQGVGCILVGWVSLKRLSKDAKFRENLNVHWSWHAKKTVDVTESKAKRTAYAEA